MTNVDLPAFPVGSRNTVLASRLTNKAAFYRGAATGLRQEIAAAEEALLAAVEAEERRVAARAKLTSIAHAHTQRTRRF